MCYTHVPNVKRDKLKTKSKVGMFLGYSSNFKECQIYILETKKNMFNRDVKFNEFFKWNWEKSQIGGLSKEFPT